VNVNVIVTGANRGLGLALLEAFLKDGAFVSALCRRPPDNGKLHSFTPARVNALRIHRCDLSDNRQITKAAEQISRVCDHIDLIINNAALLIKDESIESLSEGVFLESMAVNAFAPLAVAKAFLPLLKEASNPRIINISSASGVVERVRSFNGLYSYKASKAALNMLTRILALELRNDGIVVTAVDPGWMRTDMGGRDATGTPEETAAGILRISRKLTMEDTGRFLRWDGASVEW